MQSVLNPTMQMTTLTQVLTLSILFRGSCQESEYVTTKAKDIDMINVGKFSSVKCRPSLNAFLESWNVKNVVTRGVKSFHEDYYNLKWNESPFWRECEFNFRQYCLPNEFVCDGVVNYFGTSSAIAARRETSPFEGVQEEEKCAEYSSKCISITTQMSRESTGEASDSVREPALTLEGCKSRERQGMARKDRIRRENKCHASDPCHKRCVHFFDGQCYHCRCEGQTNCTENRLGRPERDRGPVSKGKSTIDLIDTFILLMLFSCFIFVCWYCYSF